MKTFQEKLISSAIDYEGNLLLLKLVNEKGYSIEEVADLVGYNSKAKRGKYSNYHLYRVIIGQASCSRYLYHEFKRIFESENMLQKPKEKVEKITGKKLNLLKLKNAAFILFEKKGKFVSNKEIAAMAGIEYRVMEKTISKKKLYEQYLVTIEKLKK